MSYVTTDFVKQLSVLEPFGNGNPKPVFAQKNVTFSQVKAIGKQGQFYKAVAKGEDGFAVDALYFGPQDLWKQCMEKSDTFMITYYPQINTFGNREQIQIVITDICV